MTDIFVIGNGLAGLSAAVRLAELGEHVTVVSVCEPCRTQSVLAGGGINACLNTKNQNDSVELHAEDTLKAGHYLADPKAVGRLTKAAPELVQQLAKEGVVFSRDEYGNIDLRYFGGQKKMRTAFSKSGIGKQLVTGLSSLFYKYIAQEKITFMKGYRFVSPVLSGTGRCIGVVLENTRTGNLSSHPVKGLIAASGGLGNLFSKSTGALTSDAGVSAALFSSGIKMANLEMIQYHPTTIQTPSKCILISESARGDGGRLFTFKDGKRWYFMEELYPEEGNLMPRDVVSRTIHKVCCGMHLGINGEYKVGLQLEHLEKKILSENLKEICRISKTYLGLDPAKEYIPVSPGIHYFMGGIYTDYLHRTTIPGIYAAGECACQYHGANRLGGNSTLGAIFGGRTAAETAALEAESPDASAADAACRAELDRVRAKAGLKPSLSEMRKLREIMDSCMGVARDSISLTAGLEALSSLKKGAKGIFPEMVLLAEAMVCSALSRKESRGAHYRTDFPDEKAEFAKVAVASYENSAVTVSFDEIGREFA